MHLETHKTENINWLRAAVLGANDGIVSVASLVVGVAASGVDHDVVMISAIAGTIAGAMSMAAGEYVSVSSQADSEKAIRKKESEELAQFPEEELEELTNIYVSRGLDEALAKEVAVALTAYDALGTHMREELGITEALAARPFQAALASAISFLFGAGLPVLVAYFSTNAQTLLTVSFASLVSLAMLGALSAYVGGASILKASTRVAFWGALAMVMTIIVGNFFAV